MGIRWKLTLRCLVLAQSRHPDAFIQCLLLGEKRTSQECTALSAFDPFRHFARSLCCTRRYPLIARPYSPSKNLEFSLFAPDLTRLSVNLEALWIMRRENTMGRGLLIAALNFSTAHADEFHDWYDLEHIPERQTVPGVNVG